MTRLSISLFKNKEDNVVQAQELPWEALAELLTQHKRRSGKNGKAWSPASYRPGSTRGTKGVESISALVLDFDCGVSPAELENLWDGLLYAVATTHNHKAEHPKFRVMFPLSKPVPAENWPDVYERLTLKLGRALCDPACKDVSRIYYLPSAPPETWDQRFSYIRDGSILDAEDAQPVDPLRPEQAVARPGDDYNRRADWASLLTKHGAKPALRGKDLWVRPGKDPKDGHSATTGARGGELLYVFTSEWPPFEAGKSYDKFGAYTLLEHGGDYSAAARALTQSGYSGSETPSAEKESVATKLVRLAQEEGVKLCCSVQGVCYAEVYQPVRAFVRLDGGDFKDWLRGRYFRRYRKSVSEQAIAEAVGVLVYEARYENLDRVEVHVRVAGDQATVWIDLGTNDRKVVKVTARGWEVLDDCPVYFWRPKNMRPLPMPERGGSLTEIRPFVNVGSDQDLALVLAWGVMALHPTGPYPILMLAGERGSAKSTTARVLKELTDPSAVSLRNLPSDDKDLKVAAINSHVLVFDNLSRITQHASDNLCKLATGGGIGNRANYTDDEEAVFEGKRPVILTAIEDVVEKPDLVDRTLFPKLPPILSGYRSEEAMNREFDATKGRIFGALLDALAAGLRNYSSVVDAGAFRMADFAKFAEAASSAFGLGVSFRESYAENRAAIHQGVADASPVCAAILSLVEDDPWRGTPTELVTAMTARVSEAERKFIPTVGKQRGSLKTALPLLRQQGVEFEEGRTGRRRWLAFKKVTGETVTAVTPSPVLVAGEDKEVF